MTYLLNIDIFILTNHQPYCIILFMKQKFHKLKPIERAFAILDLFTHERKFLSFTDIVHYSGLPKATVFRLTRTLEENGLLQKARNIKDWIIGPRLIGKLALLMNQNVVACSYDHMRWLRDKTHETVCLWQRVGNMRVCILQLESTNELRMVAEPGKSVPLYCGGAGKILLAYMSSQELDEYFKQVPLEPVGARTILSENRLRCELSRIKTEGISVGVNERTPNGVGIAAPLYTADGQIEHCLSLYLPVLRFSHKVKKQMIPLLKEVASNISADLGFQPKEASRVHRRKKGCNMWEHSQA